MDSSTSQEMLLLSASTPATASGSDTEMSTDVSAAPTPIGSGTPTGSVVIPSRDRSGTIIARPVWDPLPPNTAPPTVSAITTEAESTATIAARAHHHHRARRASPSSPGQLTDTSRPETETEDDDGDGVGEGDLSIDGDGDVDMDRSRTSTTGTANTITHSSRNSRRTASTSTSISHPRSSRVQPDSDVASGSSPERQSQSQLTHRRGAGSSHSSHTIHVSHSRRAVGIVSDEPQASTDVSVSGDAHINIVINDPGTGGVGVGVGGVSVEGVGVETMGGSVEDGIVSLEPNDDFAMGAPPGAPGAMVVVAPGVSVGEEEGERLDRRMQRQREDDEELIGGRMGVDVGATPRAGVVGLPGGPAIVRPSTGGGVPVIPAQHHYRVHQRTTPVVPATATMLLPGGPRAAAAATAAGNRDRDLDINNRDRESGDISTMSTTTVGSTGASSSTSGPYRDEDVLLSLQLLAYLSKYPHVRQAFYKQRATFHPASVDIQAVGTAPTSLPSSNAASSKAALSVLGKGKEDGKEKGKEAIATALGGLFKGVGAGRGKEKEKLANGPSATPVIVANVSSSSTSSTATIIPPPLPRQTNVFSLVERFTFKPSSTETDLLPHPPPRLPPEIQYWAGVIMRNACRKDESRGGVRQCANS